MPPVSYDPPFADILDQYVREARVLDREGYRRYATYWKEAPETKGKTCRAIFKSEARDYRTRRQEGGAPGAKRNRGGGSIATLNKELRFACGACNEFIAQVEERNERLVQQGRTPDPVPSNPFASRRGENPRRKLYEAESETPGRSLTIDEARRLFAALPDVDARRKVLCAILSGVDLTPMFHWTWDENIDFEARVIRGMRRKGTGEMRHFQVPMNDDLYRVAARVYIHASARKKRAAVDALNGLLPAVTEHGTEHGPILSPSTDTEQ